MVRTPSGSKKDVNRGAWTAEEDMLLTKYIKTHGETGWRSLPKNAGLNRCGKSCRLRWLNYLRPDIKRGNISSDEEELIIRMHRLLGNRWALIAGRLPGRTDNEIKNYWNTHLSKKLAMSRSDSKSQNHASSKQHRDQACSSDSSQNNDSPSIIRSALHKQVSSPPPSEAQELEVFPSWTQFLEDPLMIDIAEEPLIELNNGFVFEHSYSQIGLGNDSSSTSSSNFAMPELERVSSESNVSLDFNFFSLPCINLGLEADSAVDDMLQHTASVIGDISPVPRCDNFDNCLSKAAEQRSVELCSMNSLQQCKQLELCDLLDYEETWEDQLVGRLIQENYEDIFVDSCN